MKKYNSEEDPDLEVVEAPATVAFTAMVNVQFNGGEYLVAGQHMEVPVDEFEHRFSRLEHKGYIERD